MGNWTRPKEGGCWLLGVEDGPSPNLHFGFDFKTKDSVWNLFGIWTQACHLIKKIRSFVKGEAL